MFGQWKNHAADLRKTLCEEKLCKKQLRKVNTSSRKSRPLACFFTLKCQSSKRIVSTHCLFTFPIGPEKMPQLDVNTCSFSHIFYGDFLHLYK